MADFKDELFVNLIEDVLKKSLSSNLDNAKEFTYGDYVTISDLIENEIGETCSHVTLKKYILKAGSNDVSNLSQGTVEVLAAYVLEKRQRKALQKGSSRNWIIYKSTLGRDKKSSFTVKRLLITLLALLLLIMGGYIGTNVLFKKKLVVGIAINSDNHEFFQWLETEFEASCNCDLSFDRRLDSIDNRSSRSRVVDFLNKKNVDIIFGGSIGIYSDPQISQDLAVLDKYLPTIQDKRIPYDQSSKKWIGLYQKVQGILYNKNIIEKANLINYASFLDIIYSEHDYNVLLPRLERNQSLIHHFILNLAHETGGFDFNLAFQRYLEILKQGNVFYNDNSIVLKNSSCFITELGIDAMPFHFHDALQLVEDKNIDSSLGTHVFPSSIPTLSCLGILKDSNVSTKIARKFIETVISKKAQIQLFTETYKIPVNSVAFEEVITDQFVSNIVTLPELSYEKNHSVNLVIDRLNNSVSQYNKVTIPSQGSNNCIIEQE